jgi:LSD1 subclass zinc finger protein
MTTRVVVEKQGREYLCRAEPGKTGLRAARWRCGSCLRGFLKPIRGTDRAQCAVCHAALVAVLGDSETVPIPPAGQMLTSLIVDPVPHGWDVVCRVRALRNQLPDGRTITKEGAAILTWQALSDGLQRGGADLKAMVDQLADVALPNDDQEKQP